MTYEPLHHKYRPQTFAQLVGQEAIATTLSNALRQRRIAPAYLFTGPRGTGKTSSARILAKSLNCSQSDAPTDAPCGTCEICQRIARGSALDVIEIDAASNTGVDNIRELIERAQFAPVECRYKVYIIDEVHMLSTAAFNALLKTLEEPPAQVVFVLATTDPQRVLPTIISRCQRFDYRRIPLDAMVDHLMAIAQKEAIDATPEAVELVAQIAQGGLRDAESLLDQLSLLDGQITVERVWDLVGAVPERDLLALVRAIAQDNGTAVLDQARHLMNRGREPLIVLQNLASFYRDLLIAKTAGDRRDLVTLTQPTWDDLCAFAQSVSLPTILHGQQHLRESEVQVKNTTQPRLWLEITLMGLLPSALSQNMVGQRAVNTAGSNPGHITGQSDRRPIGPSNGVGHAVAPTPPAEFPTPGSQSPGSQSPGSQPTPPVHGSPGHPQAPQPSPQHSAPIAAQATSTSTSDTSPESHKDGDRPTDHAEHPSQVGDQHPAGTNGHAPAPVPSSAATTPLADSPGYAAFQQEKLNQLWNNVLANITRLGTRALLQQYGCLLGFDGRMARVGIKTKNLMGIAQSKQADIEDAFQRIQGTKVVISLEVGSLAEDTAASPGSQFPSPPTVSEQPADPFSSQAFSNPATPTASPAIAPPSPPPTGTPPDALSSDTVSPQAAAHDRTPSAPPPTADAPLTESSSPPPSSPDPGAVTPLAPPPMTSWQDEDEVTKAAKSLAQMFNGAIVNLDDDDLDELPLFSSSPDSHAPQAHTNNMSAEGEQNGHTASRGENGSQTDASQADALMGRSPTDFGGIPNPTPKRPINMDDVPF